MFVWNRRKYRPHGPARLPSYVRNVNSATCLFCPYGTDLKVGDRVVAWDEKTVFGREQRERLVEITDIKIFRTNGRIITLDFVVTSEEELECIATDSEIAPHILLKHRVGKSTYDAKNPPMVIYFRPCEERDAVLALVPDLDITAARHGPLRPDRNNRQRGGFMRWLWSWIRKAAVGPKPDRYR